MANQENENRVDREKEIIMDMLHLALKEIEFTVEKVKCVLDAVNRLENEPAKKVEE